MKKLSSSFLTGGLLLMGLAAPRVSFGITGCTNSFLIGTYNAQVSTLNFASVLVAPASSSGSTGSAASESGSSAAAATAGFGSNPSSLSGNVPGLGRFFFDGNGNIVGTNPNSLSINASAVVGSYTVNSDCTARFTLGSQTFDGVIVDSGNQVLFLETDSAGAAAAGTLLRSRNSCTGGESPGSFGFSFSGAMPTSQTTGGVTTTTNMPVAALGQLTLQPGGNFQITASLVQNNSVQRVTGSGTYTLGSDCGLRLTFTNSATSNGAAVPSALLNALTFRGLLVGSDTAVLTSTPATNTTLTGTLIAQ